MRRLLCVLFAIATAAAGVTATQQPRDTSGAPAQTGSASIAGTVVARDGGAVVRGARVALVGPDVKPVVIVTGDDGNFNFQGLAPGAYRLWAARAGFVAASYGEKRPGAGLPGAWIVVEAGQRRDRLKLQVPRGGVITGVVIDASGEPAVGLIVTALRTVMTDGRRTLVPTGFQEVSDQGTYRLHGLPPGEYVVASASMGGIGLTELMDAGFGSRGSSLAPMELRTPGGDEMFAGMAPSVTFHPRATRVADASRVVVASGDEQAGIDIRQLREPTVHVSGTVRDASGPARSGEMPMAALLLSKDDDQDAQPDFPGMGAGTSMVAKGEFNFARVQPGRYELRIVRQSAEGAMDWARLDISVGGTNVEGLVLTLEPGIRVSGTLESDSGPLPAIESLSFSPESNAGNYEMAFQPVRIENGRFVTHGLMPGRYRVSMSEGVSGWRLASAMFGNVDALDFLLDVKPGDAPVGRITLTKTTTEISGTVTGKIDPATNYFVVAFAADERYWLPGGRRTAAVEADPRGRFVIKNLPAGQYRLAVVADFDSIAGVYPALLRQIAPTATADVTVRDGDRITQDVRIK